MYEEYTNSETKYADKMREEENKKPKTAKDSSGNSTKPKTTTTTTVTTSTNAEEPGSTWEDLFNSLFNKTVFFYLILFLGIYIVLYFLFGIFFNKGGDVSSFQLKISRTLDFIFFGFVILSIVSYLYSGSAGSTESSLFSMFSKFTIFIMNPSSIVTVFLFLVAFYVIVYLFRIPMTSDIKPFCISLIETLGWLTFVIIVIIDFFQYVLGIPIASLFASFWNKLPDDRNVRDSSNNHIVKDSSNNKVDKKKGKIVDNTLGFAPDEVFNVSNNLYTYDDAQAICTAYGAKMATYDQMEDAYENGAEWCNYGWSDGQMIFFPTQKSTWQELQKDPAKKNNCGRPGINGGYIDNPYIKFGVNCFGKKPQPSAADLERVNAEEIPAVKPEDAALNAKIKYWKDNAAELLKINSFNKTEWSEY
jgi:hypothetical protein